MAFTKRKRKVKVDWYRTVSIGLSLIACSVSFAVAYFTVLTQFDEFRVTIDAMPAISPHRDRLEIVGPLRLSFSNSGTRSIEVTDMNLLVVQPPQDIKNVEACKMSSDRDMAIEESLDIGDIYSAPGSPLVVAQEDAKRQLAIQWMNIEPFPVRPDEFVFKSVAIERAKDDPILLTSKNGGNKGSAILCLQIKFISANKRYAAGLALTENNWQFVSHGDDSDGSSAYYQGMGPFGSGTV